MTERIQVGQVEASEGESAGGVRTRSEVVGRCNFSAGAEVAAALRLLIGQPMGGRLHGGKWFPGLSWLQLARVTLTAVC